MRILIVNPPSIEGIKYVREGRCEQRSSSFQYMMVPISLPSIAALLIKNGYDVKILDCIADSLTDDDVLKATGDFNPELFILNTSTPTFENDIKIIKRIKEKFGNIHLTAIGIHVTVLPEESLRLSKLDSVIRREPELTALALADCIKTRGDLSLVEGISFKSEKEITNNPERTFCDNLNELPFPARNLLNNNKYTLPVINRPYTLVISSRGCPYQCIFCTASLYYGSKLRLRSPENILAEIDEVVKKYKVKDITMWSDTFTLNRQFVVDICQGIIDKKFDIQWTCNSRVDKVDPELLALMKKSGCIGISYGIESGVQEILDNIKKDITLKQIRDAFKWTNEAGIETLAHVIFGLPGETKETIKETVRFVKGINPDYAQFYCAIPFPGTEFHRMAKQNGWLTDEKWSMYEINRAMISTPKLPVEELRKARLRAFLSFYLRPSYIIKRLGKLKSFDDFMINFRQLLSFIRGWVKES